MRNSRLPRHSGTSRARALGVSAARTAAHAGQAHGHQRAGSQGEPTGEGQRRRGERQERGDAKRVTEVSGGEAADDLAQRAAGDDWRVQALGLTRMQQTAERDPEDQHRDRFDLLRDQHQQHEDAAHVGQCQQPERQQRRRQQEADARQQRQLRRAAAAMRATADVLTTSSRELARKTTGSRVTPMRLRKNVSDALTSATDPAWTRKNVAAAHANTASLAGLDTHGAGETTDRRRHAGRSSTVVREG